MIIKREYLKKLQKEVGKTERRTPVMDKQRITYVAYAIIAGLCLTLVVICGIIAIPAEYAEHKKQYVEPIALVPAESNNGQDHAPGQTLQEPEAILKPTIAPFPELAPEIPKALAAPNASQTTAEGEERHISTEEPRQAPETSAKTQSEDSTTFQNNAAGATLTSLGVYKIVGYDPYCGHCCKNANGITASGKIATIGKTVAMYDMPFGTEIYIEGMGCYTVEDRGVGRGVVDIAMGDHAACYAITNTKGLEVFIVGE